MSDPLVSMYRDPVSVVTVYHNKGERPAIDIPHLHSQYEIYYNIRGASGFFANKKLYECTGYDLFIIPSVCIHKVIANKGGQYERCIISIDTGIVDSINAIPWLNRPLAWLNCASPMKVNLTQIQHQQFITMIDQYGSLKENTLLQFAKLIELTAFIRELFPIGQLTEGTEKVPLSVAENALVLIEEQFKTIKVSELSQKLFVEKSHLSMLFKNEYGVTLTNYLLIRKIAEAKKCLYLGASVKEACYLSGFRDYSNFIRTFKKIEGYPPGALEKLTDPL